MKVDGLANIWFYSIRSNHKLDHYVHCVKCQVLSQYNKLNMGVLSEIIFNWIVHYACGIKKVKNTRRKPDQQGDM